MFKKFINGSLIVMVFMVFITLLKAVITDGEILRFG